MSSTLTLTPEVIAALRTLQEKRKEWPQLKREVVSRHVPMTAEDVQSFIASL